MTERDEIVEVIATAIWKAEDWRQAAEDALSALEAAGVRLVPVEATTDMQNAAAPLLAEVNSIIVAHAVRTGGSGLRTPVSLADIYAAMLSASPYAPAAAPGGKDER